MTTPAPPDYITLDTIVNIAGPIIAAAAFISGVWWRVEGKIDKVRTDADAAAKAASEKAHATEKELAEFKLKVAEEYASWETVRAIEVRLTERMDNLSENVMKMPDVIVDRIVNMVKLSQLKA
jgi:hypothetical protein